MFINEDDQKIYIEEPDQGLAKMGERLRERLMDDINSETYNFFSAVTKKEEDAE